jgi:hypothetical protein
VWRLTTAMMSNDNSNRNEVRQVGKCESHSQMPRSEFMDAAPVQ